MTRVHFNLPSALPVDAPRGDPRAFHRRLPGYAPTPLRAAPGLAERANLANVWVKDESNRLGLPAFKVLGASWACFRASVDLLGEEPEWRDIDELRSRFADLQPLMFVTATDGNHGRAVAHMASLFGFDARIFVPAGTADARVAAIESEGADVIVVNGSYDDAVEVASQYASPRCLVISDTAWLGYTEMPQRVIDGYSTLFHEVDDALDVANEPQPDIVFAQIGVGALAAAVVTHYRQPGRQTRVVGLEPDDAACAFESLATWKLVTVPGPHRSMMVGMNCGTLSPLAWPILRAGLDCAMTVDDTQAADAMRSLAAEGIVSGETGSAGAAALLALLAGPGAGANRERLQITPASSALIISTEGATDPEAYQRTVGVPASSI